MTDTFGNWSERETEELWQVFYAQAHELLEELQDCLLRLEGEPPGGDTLKIVKRHLHTLKGDSRAMGLGEVGRLCHRMEDVLSFLMDNGGGDMGEGVEILLSCLDAVRALVAASEDGREAALPGDVIDRIDRLLGRVSGGPEALREVRKNGPVPAASGDDGGNGTDAAPSLPPAAAIRRETLRVEASRVDLLLELVGELIIGRSMIEQMTRESGSGASPAEFTQRLQGVNASLERTVADLQKGIMKMRMVPVRQVFRTFPRIVRDLTAEKGKQARLELVGSETELDKRIVDALAEPLSHLVRNLVDHGLEPPAERLAAGKEAEGVITLRAYHEASRIVIEAKDDGRGIDPRKLRQKAVERGFLSREVADRMPDAEAVDLVFLPGLSTAESVSETSGRGVGMEAVKTAVEAMKGSLEIETAPGKGTLFRVRLPLTLAVIKALLFEAAGRLYAVPVPMITEVARIMTDDLVTVDGRPVLLQRDRILSLIMPHDLFGTAGNGSGKKFVLVLGLGAKKAGLVADRILWQQELVIKALDRERVQSPLVAGASILGNGKVVLILDAEAVFKKVVEEEKARRTAAA
jgi:two-component system chemotaxis sensor kinase CheA